MHVEVTAEFLSQCYATFNCSSMLLTTRKLLLTTVTQYSTALCQATHIHITSNCTKSCYPHSQSHNIQLHSVMPHNSKSYYSHIALGHTASICSHTLPDHYHTTHNHSHMFFTLVTLHPSLLTSTVTLH